MSIRRAVPDLQAAHLDEMCGFYRSLGFEEAMDLGWVVTLASPVNATAQVTLQVPDVGGPPLPDLTVEVTDVDAVHDAVRAQGHDVVYALRDEPWGVRRFIVRDPDGHVVNVMSHIVTRRPVDSHPRRITMRRPRLFGQQATGVPIPWSWAQQRLQDARNYWVAACRPSARPHVRPVWGIWYDDGFWYSTGSRMISQLDRHPGLAVHLESGEEVVIVEGDSGVVESSARRQQFVDGYNEKYRWSLTVRDRGVGDDAGAEGEVVVVRPSRVYAWTTADLEAATCWEFAATDG